MRATTEILLKLCPSSMFIRGGLHAVTEEVVCYTSLHFVVFFVVDESAGTEKHVQVERLEVPTSHSMEGFLNQRVDEDEWLKCWVCLLISYSSFDFDVE